MRKIIVVLGKVLLGIILFFVLYLLTAFCLSRITVNQEVDTKEEISIYILTNGVHTDIVTPIRTSTIDWSKKINYSHIKSKDSAFKYIAFGWGDKGFYLETPEWKDLKFSVAFKAATGLSSSAMHTTYYKNMIVGDDCREIKISIEQYKRLVNFIDKSFSQNKEGSYINIVTDAVYGNDDAFYEGTGSYSLFYTCNTWANNVLKHSGQKSCLWTIFDTGIFLKYKK